MFRLIIVSIICCFVFDVDLSYAQESIPNKEVSVAEAGANTFHREVILAAIDLNHDGKLSRRDVIKLRVAMISPAFREKAQELAVIQMNASGSENAPGADIDPASIDWAGLTAFMEKLIPLLIQLISAFSSMSDASINWGAFYAVLIDSGQITNCDC